MASNRRKLLKTTEPHTILRLPTSIRFSPGAKAIVVLFEKKAPTKQY